MEKLVNNVLEFIDVCSEKIGKFESKMFILNMSQDGVDCVGDSPIEQILNCALHTILRMKSLVYDSPIEVDGKMYNYGLVINAQESIGKYYIDFKISHYKYPRLDNCQRRRQEIREVLVECDSQTWHERNEKERRYEKKRDRYLVAEGYKVFHFTGTEIVRHPLEIADEIITFVTK